jgi:hypothetical protein
MRKKLFCYDEYGEFEEDIFPSLQMCPSLKGQS